MILFENSSSFDVDSKIFEDISAYLSNKDIELVIVNDAQMREINLDQREIDKSTDVLSFPLLDMPNSPLGSVVINIELSKDVALEQNHNLEDELKLMFTHGMLHLLGYDHEVDAGEMREMEEKVVEHFSLPKSLIIRSES